MAESAAARQLTTVLAVTYPVLAHIAVTRGSAVWTAVAVALLALVLLLPALASGRAAAWAAVPLVIAGCWWLTHAPLPMLPLYAPPVLLPAFLGWVFGRTLLRGRTPLIEQLIRVLHPAGSEPQSAAWSYARRLTVAWTGVFAVLAGTNLLLAAVARPDGLLLASGITPPLTVPQHWWSLFANLLGYLVVAAFFMIEYAYRRRRFPQQPYRNMLDFLRRMLAALPRLAARNR